MRDRFLFTCSHIKNGRVFTIYARNRVEADRLANWTSGFIIQGSMRDIRVRRRVGYVRELGFFIARVHSDLKIGVVCTIMVGSSLGEETYQITNATYQGRAVSFLSFIKNGVRFWTKVRQTKFVSINRKKL